MQLIINVINILAQGVLWLLTIAFFGYGSIMFVSSGMAENGFYQVMGIAILFLFLAYLTNLINKKIYNSQDVKQEYQEIRVWISIIIIQIPFFLLFFLPYIIEFFFFY